MGCGSTAARGRARERVRNRNARSPGVFKLELLDAIRGFGKLGGTVIGEGLVLSDREDFGDGGEGRLGEPYWVVGD